MRPSLGSVGQAEGNMKPQESAFKRRREAGHSAGEIMHLFSAALHAADEMGLDSVAIVREVLEAENVSPKKENENP